MEQLGLNQPSGLPASLCCLRNPRQSEQENFNWELASCSDFKLAKARSLEQAPGHLVRLQIYGTGKMV
jgi:hypothetical protein